MSKLPKNVQITRLSKGKYSLEFSKFCWEPTLDDLKNIRVALISIASRENLKIESFSVYIRNGDIAFGTVFKHPSKKQLENKFNIIIFDRE